MKNRKSKKNSEEKKQKSKRNFSAKEFWKNLWTLLSPLQKKIKVLFFLIFIAEIVNLAGPYFLKIAIDLLANFGFEKTGEVFVFVILIFVAYQLTSLINYFSNRIIFFIVAESEVHLTSSAHSKMINLDFDYHQRENTGNKVSKILRGVDKITTLIWNFFGEVAPTIFQLILTIFILFFVDWRFAIIVLFFAPIFIFITINLNKSIYPIRRRRFDDMEIASGMMVQSIININTVKSFVQEKREIFDFSKISNSIKQCVLGEFYKILNVGILRNFVIDAGRISMLLFGVFLVWKGEITIGSLVFVVTISEKALLSLYRISRLYDRIMESSEAVTRLHELSKQESDIKNPKNGIKPSTIEGVIDFKKISFAYKGSGTEALKDVDLRIAAGCVTALVGPSGGGKTTLARLIYRHYDPNKGEILLDGIDLKKYDIYAFRKFISIVPQEVEIFNSTIAENISYAKPEASLREIKAAAQIANAGEFIDLLPKKYKTIVGERGMRLSGGQRQRIGIARAVLANPKILIFDEATSNLDSQSERYIQEALEKVGKNRTVIIVAHRLSTVQRADKIVVLEKGRVIEVGSHFELARNEGGVYRKLIDLQKMGEIE